MRGINAAACFVAALVTAGCSCGSPMLVVEDDAGSSIDATPDARPTTDAPPELSDVLELDSPPDAPDDAPVFDCASCPEPSPCQILHCDGACDYEPVPDGTACDPSGVCIGGACVPRGCGDGYREPGPKPPREQCDDGNDIDTDLCRDCTAQVYVVSSAADTEDVTYGPDGIGVDGRGHALAIWVRRAPGGGGTRWAQRFDARGAPEGTPIDLGAGALAPGARVVGLAEGWAVAASSAGISIAIVTATGAVRPARNAAEGSTGVVRDAALGVISSGDMLAGWSDVTTPTASRVYVRWLEDDARPAAMPMLVSTTGAVAPSIEVSGPDIALVVWTDLRMGMPARLVGRRLTRDGWIDASAFEVDATPASHVALASRPGGWWVAWITREIDSEGDVHVRAVAETGPAITGTAMRVTGLEADGSPRGETAPTIAPAGTGWLAAWERTIPREVEMALGATGTSGPEFGALADALATGNQRGVSVEMGPRGIWVVWADGSAGDPTALRSVATALLPPL